MMQDRLLSLADFFPIVLANEKRETQKIYIECECFGIQKNFN